MPSQISYCIIYPYERKLSCSDAQEHESIVKNYLLKIFKMYVVWMLLYTPVAIYFDVACSIPLKTALIDYFRRLVLVGEQYNSWPLWYLLSSTYALLLILCLKKRKVSLNGILLIGVAISVVAVWCDWIVKCDENTMPIFWAFVREVIVQTTGSGRILRGSFLIPIGMYLYHKKLPVYVNPILFAVTFVLDVFVKNGPLGTYLLIVKMVAFFGLVESIKLKDAGIYHVLRDMSTVIYLIHMYVWIFYYKAKYGYRTFGKDSFLVVSVVATLIALAYVLIRRKISGKRAISSASPS